MSLRLSYALVDSVVESTSSAIGLEHDLKRKSETRDSPSHP